MTDNELLQLLGRMRDRSMLAQDMQAVRRLYAENDALLDCVTALEDISNGIGDPVKLAREALDALDASAS